MDLLQRAIDIATKAHEGQVDKAGKPYIEHPLRVMNMGITEQEKILGVLHDIVEDTEWTFTMLKDEGFSDEIIDALRCITKRSNDESYDKFIQRIKKNPLAVKVKLNDLTDNMDIRRLPYLSEKDIKRLKKYLRAYKQLTNEPTYSIEACRAEHPNAFNPWTDEEDERLKQYLAEGKTVKEIAKILKRKEGGIESRIKKMK